MDIVEKLYSLIQSDNSINTFNNNIELFQQFYFSGMSIKYNGPKTITVMLYLLSVKPDDYNFPLLKSNIFSSFYDYEQFITQSVYDTSVDHLEKVEEIKELIIYYNQFKKYDEEDKYLKNSIFVRDYTGALIILLNKHYFELSDEDIKFCIEKIKNNDYIKEISNNDTKKGLLDKEYTFDYFSRYLFTSEFVNIDNLEDDILLNKLFSGEIKDVNFVERAYKNMAIDYVRYHFESLEEVFDSIDKVTDDEYKRIDIKRLIINKLIEQKDYLFIFRYIMKHLDTDIIEDNLKESIKLLTAMQFDSNLTEEDAKNILKTNNHAIVSRNLKVKCDQENWSPLTKSIIKERTKDINTVDMPFEEAISNLKRLFNGEQVSFNKMMRVLTSIIKTYLNDDKVRVYFFSEKNVYGQACDDKNEVFLNIFVVKELLSYKGMGDDPEKLKVLETLFHECKHIEQFYDMNDEEMTDNSFTEYKEELLRYYNSGYYSKNYSGVSYEKEARVFGAGSLVYFMKSYFPEMTDVIDYYSKKMEYEKNREFEDKEIFELSRKVSVDEAFDKLVSINPSVIFDNKLLSKEYNLDGTKKDKKRKGVK